MMEIRSAVPALALPALGVAAAPSHAAISCALTNITPSAVACSGFCAGNLLNSSPADVAIQKNALAALGFTWDGTTIVDSLSPLGGSHAVDFPTLLVGDTYVAIHFGNGTGGPGNATAFYKLNAGAGLDTFTLNYNASSNAVLYSTSPVPEPESYALMLAGPAAVGFVARRRKAA